MSGPLKKVDHTPVTTHNSYSGGDMTITIYSDRRNLTGRGCPCGLDCWLNRYLGRPRNAADRTVSYRRRSGSRREKRLARG
jgi:hypothetical protein